MAEALEQHWARHGTGPQAHYHALRWNALEQQLLGIANPDPIKLSSLVGQGQQQARLSKNIQRLLAGLPAQDMLLYGPPGTGKSSTVKALVNAYADQGLRLVEVQKEDIGDLPAVVRQLGERAPRYLVFIDDLSFEDHEVAYKALKVVLEGTAQARPANVLICATSNRLNLVRENFSDRGKPAEDVNWRDTMDEKQSLAHRFGLRVTFMSPDQRQYLNIVETLTRQRALEIPAETLQELALQWERQHTGRSGRVARQFIDDLEADLKYRQA
jgi:predicted AAA+ superfamily ATPase